VLEQQQLWQQLLLPALTAAASLFYLVTPHACAGQLLWALSVTCCLSKVLAAPVKLLLCRQHTNTAKAVALPGACPGAYQSWAGVVRSQQELNDFVPSDHVFMFILFILVIGVCLQLLFPLPVCCLCGACSAPELLPPVQIGSPPRGLPLPAGRVHCT